MIGLFYVLMAFPGTGWHDAIALHTTAEPGRCEAVKAQIELAPATGMRYECHTLVAPRGPK